MVSSMHIEPVSRTDQYKRVMKPLLERKRRARINRCLDELRDLLVSALQAEGETVTRLEKADILELTVRHVKRLNDRKRFAPASTRSEGDPRECAFKFQQGFIAATQQVQSYLLSSSTIETGAVSRLMVHLSSCANAIPPPDAMYYSKSPVSPSISPRSASMSPSSGIYNTALPPHVSNNIIIRKCSPPLSPPLIDLSTKPREYIITPKILAPTPVRLDSLNCTGPKQEGPQDLSLKKPATPTPINPDAWRPW